MEQKIRQIKGTLWLKKSSKSLITAAQIVRAGGLVAFPTETVYGLGASAFDSAAVERIFKAKGRPSDNPLIVHVSHPDQVNRVAVRVTDRARCLMDRFWPGPLSLVLPRGRAVPDRVSAGLPTVAVRMPDHPVALQLIRTAGVPLAAPSANLSGRPSPTSARHVLEDLAGRIEAVLDGGPCEIGVESTVLDLTASPPVILRPGKVTREELSLALGVPVLQAVYKGEATPLSPGMKYRHYAPRAPLLLLTGPRRRRKRMLEILANYYRRRGFQVCLLQKCLGPGLEEALNYEEYLSRTLYRGLRRCDEQSAEIILAEGVVPRGFGAAIMNRLSKAAFRVLRV